MDLSLHPSNDPLKRKIFPLMSLPAELRLRVMEQTSGMEALSLRLTSRYFYDLIDVTTQRLFDAEKSEYARTWKPHVRNDESNIFVLAKARQSELFACAECMRLRPAHKFLDSDLKGEGMAKNARVSKERRYRRCCMDCKRRRFPDQLGTNPGFTMAGMFWRRCSECEEYAYARVQKIVRHDEYCYWSTELCLNCNAFAFSHDFTTIISRRGVASLGLRDWAFLKQVHHVPEEGLGVDWQVALSEASRRWLEEKIEAFWLRRKNPLPRVARSERIFQPPAQGFWDEDDHSGLEMIM